MHRNIVIALIVGVLCCCTLAITSQPQIDAVEPPNIPLPDLTDAEPQVRSLIEARYRAVIDHPNDADAWGRFAVACHAHGLTATAEHAYAKAHALDDRTFRWVYLPGVMLVDHEPRRAIALLETARAIDPDYVPAMLRVGVLYEQTGRSDDAGRLYAEAATREPANAAARFYHGQWLLHRQDVRAALLELEAAAKLAPDARSIQATLVRAYRMTGNTPAAEEAMQATTDATSNQLLIDPMYEEVRFQAISIEAIRHRGWALLDAGRTADALAAFEQGLTHAPNHISMLRGLIMADVRLGRHAQAIDAYHQALRLEPNDAALTRGLAASQAAMRQYTESEQTLRQALASHPDDIAIVNDLAWLLATCPDDAVRNGPEAVRLAERAVASLAERTPSALDTLAAAYAASGRFDDAERTMREAIDLFRQSSQQGDTTIDRYLSRMERYRSRQPFVQ